MDNFLFYSEYCIECTKILTVEEKYYYCNRCEQCEIQWMQDIKEWLSGEENEKFDQLYGA